MKITFLSSAAPFGYAYSAGDTAEFEQALALEFIERGFAEEAPAETEVKKAVEPKPTGLKKAVKKA